MYETNFGMESVKSQKSIITAINNRDKNATNVKLVVFDLETTGLHNDAEILQIAAKCRECIFNVYVQPVNEISSSATAITGFHLIGSDLYLRKKRIETLTILEALISFQQFLSNLFEINNYILIAHNVTFDSRYLLRAIMNNEMIDKFNNIVGSSDTLSVSKKHLPERKGKDMFKLETLAKDFLVLNDTQLFHDAIYDVIVLDKLIEKFQVQSILVKHFKTMGSYYSDIYMKRKDNTNLQFVHQLRNVISLEMLKRLAAHEIRYTDILKIFEKERNEGIIKLFTEKVEDKVRITKDKRVIVKLIRYLERKDHM